MMTTDALLSEKILAILVFHGTEVSVSTVCEELRWDHGIRGMDYVSMLSWLQGSDTFTLENRGSWQRPRMYVGLS